MRKEVVILSLLMVISLLVAAFGCNTSSATSTTANTATTTSTAAPKTIKYGVLGPYTGPAASWGADFQKGHELAVDDVNNMGGIKIGNDKYVFEPIFYDHGNDSTKAVAVMNKLVFQDGAKYVSAWGSSGSLATLPITEPNGVLMHTGGFARVIGPEYPLSFRCQYTALECGEGLYGYIGKNMSQVKKVVLVSNDNETGKVNVKNSETNANAVGITVVNQYLVPAGTTDFYPTLTRILADAPDLVDTCALPPNELALFIKQSRERAYKGYIMTTSSLDISTVVTVAGITAVEGLISPDLDATSDAATPEIKALYKAYIAKYGEPFHPLVLPYYVYLRSPWAGIEAAQSIDTKVVSSKLQDLKFDSLGMELSYGGVQRYGIKRQIQAPIPVSIVNNGKLNTVGMFTPMIP